MSKVKIKNTFPHLLEAAMNHSDCPEWLRAKVWTALADNSDVPADCAGQYALFLKYSTVTDDADFERSEMIK